MVSFLTWCFYVESNLKKYFNYSIQPRKEVHDIQIQQIDLNKSLANSSTDNDN